MRILGTMNGWKDAPHCWKRFLLLPINWDVTPAYTSISIFGFVIFIDWSNR